MDGLRYLYSPTTPPAVDAIATGSCPTMLLVMPDSGDPMKTSSGFAITRRGRPGNVAAKLVRHRATGIASHLKPSKASSEKALVKVVSTHQLSTRKRTRPKMIKCRHMRPSSVSEKECRSRW